MAARRMGIMGILLCFCLCLLPLSAAAVFTSDAAGPLNPEGKCLLTLSYRCDGKTITDLPIEIYRIADVSADAQYTLTAPFLASSLTLNGIQSAGEWDSVRTTLESYMIANAIEPNHTAVTDLSGQVHWDSLPTGLYFVASTAAQADGQQCVFDSALIALPGLETGGLWLYRVAATPKPQILPPVTPDEVQTLKILKLWKDKNHMSHRPTHIEAEIFRDGILFESVILSEENHWSYSWTVPVDGARWTVVEQKIPKGYSVTVEKRGTTFVLTNTYIPKDSLKESPRTGDMSHVLLYTLLMCTSGLSLVLIGTRRKRNRP